ncbi:response regulator transcription factor [Actinocatenispora rupis]|uniref:Transcriptional regulator n=1 Tax=Actinocatenispora rupis TaxID=519421 RepID=A0A8J3J8E4_9ACTN|nr:response regulator transcription factor [Actinocatenispora rupis]GID11278.1 transcriptional regulator [Actinocatenispora rupis]
MTRLLLVEDDPELGPMLSDLLGDEGYEVALAPDGQRGLHLGLTATYDGMIIDRGLPAIDGLDLLVRLRRQGVQSAVLFLTAYGTVADRVAGLDAGAEDYLVKPFELAELLARVRALVRRHHDTAERLPLGAGLLDTGRRVAVLGDREVALSGREFELLHVLAARPRMVFGREELRRRVFEDAPAESIVDTYVYYLRRKLGRDAVRTVRGIGYQAGAL